MSLSSSSFFSFLVTHKAIFLRVFLVRGKGHLKQIFGDTKYVFQELEKV